MSGDYAYRVIIINNTAKLRLDTGCLVIETDEHKDEIPIKTIRLLMLVSTYTSISGVLIKELCVQGIKVIFCDEKLNPVGEILPYSNNVLSPDRLDLQISWSTEKQKTAWLYIIETKISLQNSLLTMIFNDDKILHKYINNINDTNVLTNESVAARIYFSKLFGSKFSRDSENDINAALNYGYTIIRNAFSRAIAIYGYNNSIGICHKGPQNQFNLACDLMEPFRVFIDKFVYENAGRIFDKKYKYDLIELLNSYIIYNNKKEILSDAIENFARDILFSMSERTIIKKRLGFA